MNNDFSKMNGIHVHAEYKDQFNPKNQGNPFIEALPDRYDVETFIDALSSKPPMDKSFSKLIVEDRLELVQQIRPDFWLPLPTHYDKYRNLYSMIKMGYQSRNPMQAMFNRQFAIGWDNIFKAGLDEKGANLAGNIHTAQSFVEIAINGYGKSQTYERILTSFFPQVIYHGEYQGRPLPTAQLVWLKVECPYNKSVGTFCKSFYAAVDKILGTTFYEKLAEKPGKMDEHVMRLIKVAAQVNLGVLVIDEIQKIQKAYSGGTEDMIDFITQFVNTLGVPTVLIGSYKALYLFKDSLANTRRGIPNGYSENISGHMLEDSWEWNEFIENLWDLQYTKTFTEITPEIKRAMFYYSMGIPDFAVKLFIHVQSKTIVNGGNERMTVASIRKVAESSLSLVQPIFEKIRNGGQSAYKDLDDVKPDWTPLNGYIKEASHRVNVYGSLTEDHARALRQKDKDEVLKQLIEFTLNLVQAPKEAETLSNQVYNASAGMEDLSSMFLHIVQLVKDNGSQSKKLEKASSQEIPKISVAKKVKPILKVDDIRSVVRQGHSRGLTTEEALVQRGYIRGIDELFTIKTAK